MLSKKCIGKDLEIDYVFLQILSLFANTDSIKSQNEFNPKDTENLSDLNNHLWFKKSHVGLFLEDIQEIMRNIDKEIQNFVFY